MPQINKHKRLFNNSLYKNITTIFNGTTEYMAMEKLHEIYYQNLFDLIILDTPPTGNALDFLHAPDRLVSFLNSHTIKWFIKPTLSATHKGFSLFSKSTAFAFSMFERVTGSEFLKDMSEFIISFKDMIDGFRERAEKVNALLKDKKTLFFMVTAADRTSLDESLFFYRELKRLRHHFGGFLINRLFPNFTEKFRMEDLEKLKNDWEGSIEMWDELEFNFHQYQLLLKLNGILLKKLSDEKIKEDFIFKIPYRMDPIHDLESVYDVLNDIVT